MITKSMEAILKVGNKIVDSKYLGGGVGEVSMTDHETVSVLYETNVIVVYPADHLEGLIVV
ncbi:hypothetical protein LCGC14_1194450 [marine sediment metagenome]|uniref:Uncharacterized protein n=1 Tax=marine sediment metagenome TaxID=412755 RepID=A0A0F9LIR9_9ZZZZ